MKKFFNLKNGIIAGVVLLLSIVTISACMAVLPKAEMNPSDYDTGLTFEKASQEDKPILTVFYVDWCTYCRRFMPKLDKVRNINKNDINVVLINVENPDNEKLAHDYRIAGYPTVYIIEPKYENRVHIENSYLESVATLNKEVNRYLNYKKMVKKDSSCK